MKRNMEKTISVFVNSIVGIRGGTINPGVIDSIKIEHHGQMTPIAHLAQTARLNTNAIYVDPFDLTIVGKIANSLKTNGLNAYQFSKTRVIVSVPPPCGEEKEKIKKYLKKLGEEAKIAIRNIRKRYRNSNEDAQDKTIQKITDGFIETIDSIVKKKVESL